MAYRVVKEPRAWWPVKWTGVTEEGEPVENRIELRFRLLKVDAVVEFTKQVVAMYEAEREHGADPQLWVELIAQMATDWRGLEAENGDPLRFDVPDGWLADRDADGKRKPLTAPNLLLLMNEPGLFRHCWEAFLDCINARHETRAGN